MNNVRGTERSEDGVSDQEYAEDAAGDERNQRSKYYAARISDRENVHAHEHPQKCVAGEPAEDDGRSDPYEIPIGALYTVSGPHKAGGKSYAVLRHSSQHYYGQQSRNEERCRDEHGTDYRRKDPAVEYGSGFRHPDDRKHHGEKRKGRFHRPSAKLR